MIMRGLDRCNVQADSGLHLRVGDRLKDRKVMSRKAPSAADQFRAAGVSNASSFCSRDRLLLAPARAISAPSCASS